MQKPLDKSLPSLPPSTVAVDTHCHLDMAVYDRDRDQVIGEAERSGVTRMITIGIDLVSSEKAVALAEQYPSVYAAIGIHPHHAVTLDASCSRRLELLTAHPKVVAYGEIGLDFVKKYTPAEQQSICFQRQVRLAKELHLPLIIHDRGAHEETMAILQAEKPFPASGVMHCFSGDLKLATAIVDLGLHISVPGIVTYENAAGLQGVVREIDLTALLLETDAPYLAPVPERGKRNRPALLLHTARKIAELKSISLADVINQTTVNAEKLFSLA